MPKSAIAEEVAIKSTPAPYLPFLTFQSAVVALEHGIPKKLDRTMWPSQSGLVQSQILMAFRFLGLVDDLDHPTDLLHELVDAKDNRATVITKILNQSYSNLIAHDLTKMTPKTVEDEMENYHVSGETKRKAVSFFLRAAKFSGMPMHPLLSAMVRNTGPRKRKAKRLYIPELSARAEVPDPPSRTNVAATIVRLSNGGKVALSISADPFTLPAEDRKFVFDLVDMLQAYAKAHPVSGEEADEEEGDDGE